MEIKLYKKDFAQMEMALYSMHLDHDIKIVISFYDSPEKFEYASELVNGNHLIVALN